MIEAGSALDRGGLLHNSTSPIGGRPLSLCRSPTLAADAAIRRSGSKGSV